MCSSDLFSEYEQIELHVELGGAYESTGRISDAISQYGKAIELIGRQRGTIRSEPGRIQYRETKERAYARLIPLLIAGGRAEEAFQYAERSKSRAFLDVLAAGDVRLGARPEAGQYEQIVRRQIEIEALIEGARVPREIASAAYDRAYRDVDVAPRTPAPVAVEFEALTSVKVASATEIQRSLGRDTALLSFSINETKTSVLLLQDGVVSAWIRPIGREVLTTAVSAIRRGLESPTADPSLSGLQAHAEALYRDLLAVPLATVRKGIVYVAPHGPLYYLPFGAIHDGRDYLVARFTFVTVPSGTVLTYLEKKAATPGMTAVFANPDLHDRRP